MTGVTGVVQRLRIAIPPCIRDFGSHLTPSVETGPVYLVLAHRLYQSLRPHRCTRRIRIARSVCLVWGLCDEDSKVLVPAMSGLLLMREVTLRPRR